MSYHKDTFTIMFIVSLFTVQGNRTSLDCTGRWMDNDYVAYIYNGVLFGTKEKWNYDIFRKRDGSEKSNKWGCLHSDKRLLCLSSGVKHSYDVYTYLYAWKVWGGWGYSAKVVRRPQKGEVVFSGSWGQQDTCDMKVGSMMRGPVREKPQKKYINKNGLFEVAINSSEDGCCIC